MKLSEAMKTRKGQLIAALIVMGFSLLIPFFSLFGSAFSALPNDRKLAKLEAEVIKLRADFEKADASRKKSMEVRKNYQLLAARSWITSHDGVVETSLRRRIGEVAGKLDFKLNSIGAVRTGRINQEFYYAEIDITGSGEFADVIRFIAALRKIDPVLSWRRLDLRPDFHFRQQQSAGSANLAARVNTLPPTRIMFNGALRVFGYDGPLTVKSLHITRLSAAELDAAAEKENPPAPSPTGVPGAAPAPAPAAAPAPVVSSVSSAGAAAVQNEVKK